MLSCCGPKEVVQSTINHGFARGLFFICTGDFFFNGSRVIGFGMIIPRSSTMSSTIPVPREPRVLQGEPSSAGFLLSATSRSYQNSVPVSDGFWMFWMFERNQRFLSHNPETYRLKTGNNYAIYILYIYT